MLDVFDEIGRINNVTVSAKHAGNRAGSARRFPYRRRQRFHREQGFDRDLGRLVEVIAAVA